MADDRLPTSRPTAIPPYDVAAYARAVAPASERAMKVLARILSLPPALCVREEDQDKLYEAIKALK